GRRLPGQGRYRSGGREGTHRVPGEEDPAQRRGPRRVDGGVCRTKKRTWGTLNGVWVTHDVRDQIVDFVRRWSEATEIGAGRFVGWLGVSSSKFYDWRERYGRVNEHNGWVPRDFWLEDWEKQAIINFHLKNPLEGYRRLTFMMLDADIVGRESVQRMAGAGSRRFAEEMERQAVEERDGVRA